MEFVLAGLQFFLSFSAFWVSLRSFREKGVLLNNAWLFATEEERETMDKKPNYRQSAIVFLFVGTIFFLNGLMVFCKVRWLFWGVIMLAVAAVVYAILSAVAIEKNKQG